MIRTISLGTIVALLNWHARETTAMFPWYGRYRLSAGVT